MSDEQEYKWKKWESDVLARDNGTSVLSGTQDDVCVHRKIEAEHHASLLCLELDQSGLRSVEFWDVDNGVTVSKKEKAELDKREIKMMNVIVTGAQGQTGSYMCEFLLEMGHNVVGLARRKSTGQNYNQNLSGCLENERFKLEYGDITDAAFINWVIELYKPEFYFNFAAMSHVGHSFSEPLKTFITNSESVVIALDAIKRISPKTKFYQASTSELFGTTPCPEGGYTEDSEFHPRSPYGIAKLAAYWSVVNYREAYGIFACNGILHNHESPRRGVDFSTRKITMGVAGIVNGTQQHLHMGNMTSFRDIGHAKDYVTAIWLIMTQPESDDYIVATGQGATIKDMLEHVCSLAGLKYEDVYREDSRFMRPSDVPYLKGDSSKIKALGWVPTYTWKTLLEEMYNADSKN